MEAKLIVVGGDVKTTEVNLKLPCIIGRGRGTGLMLPHPLVSRQHCEIYEHEQQLVVRDLGSLNGTYINNTKLTEPTLLPSGDLLTVGTVTFRAEYQMDPNLAPPSPSAKTVRGGAPTAQATTKAPAADVPDFSSFEEIEEVEVEEYASGIVKDSASLPAMSSNDDMDIMSMLEDEIEEVVEEAPQAKTPAPKKPATPAKEETPPDRGTKPTQADNRWASPNLPASDETLRARPGEAKSSKPDKKGGPGKSSASATNSPVVAEHKSAESPVADDADDFMATLGIAALAGTASPAAQEFAEVEPSNIATATPEEVDEHAAGHESNGALAAQHEASPLDETLLPESEAIVDGVADDLVMEDVADIEVVEEMVVEEVEETAPPTAENDDSLLADLGLEDISPPVEVREEPVADDSLHAPPGAFAELVEEAFELEGSARLEPAVEPEALFEQLVAEDSLQAPQVPTFTEPAEEAVDLADIELVDDVAEWEEPAVEPHAPAEVSPATDDAFLSELGLDDPLPTEQSHLEPAAEASAEPPLPPAPEAVVEASHVHPVHEEATDSPAAISDDELLSDLGLDDSPSAPALAEPSHADEILDLEVMEAVVEVDEPLAAAPQDADIDDFLADLGLNDTPAAITPTPSVAAELPPEAVSLEPAAHEPDEVEEVFELEDMQVVEEATEPTTAQVESSPASDQDIDDFLADLGMEDASPPEPLAAELPPDAVPAESESIEVEEVFDLVDMELVEEIEESPVEAESPATWLESPAPSAAAEPPASEPGRSEAWGQPIAEDSLMAPLPLAATEPADVVDLAELGLDDLPPTFEERAEPIAEDSTYAPLPPEVNEQWEEAEVAEVEFDDIELVEEFEEPAALEEPVAAITPPVDDADSFLADLGLDDPLPVSQAAPQIEPLLAYESVAEVPPETEVTASDMGVSESLVEVDPLTASAEPSDDAGELVDLSDVTGVEEVFDLDVEEVAFDEVAEEVPVAPPSVAEQSIAPLVDASNMAGAFLAHTPEALAPAEESANNFESAPPPRASDEATDDMFAEQMFADSTTDEPISDIEAVEETGEIVEVDEEPVADMAAEPEGFVETPPAPIVAPRSMPTPLHVAKPYAYANPVARFPIARWTPSVDEGPYKEPVRFAHAAPRPMNAPAVAPAIIEPPMPEAAVPPPASEAPEVVEIAATDEDLDAFLKDLGQ